MISVFYDGKCSICNKEISYYRKIAPKGVFNWQDVNQAEHILAQDGITVIQALKILHAKDINGNIYKGVDAFILIWSKLNRWRLLAFFISLPIINKFAKLIYNKFANWRFNKLTHCQVIAKKEV